MVVGKARKLLKAIKAAANDDDPCSNTLGQPKFRALEGVANDDDLAEPGVKAIVCAATDDDPCKAYSYFNTMREPNFRASRSPPTLDRS